MKQGACDVQGGGAGTLEGLTEPQGPPLGQEAWARGGGHAP